MGNSAHKGAIKICRTGVATHWVVVVLFDFVSIAVEPSACAGELLFVHLEGQVYNHLRRISASLVFAHTARNHSAKVKTDILHVVGAAQYKACNVRGVFHHRLRDKTAVAVAHHDNRQVVGLFAIVDEG